MLWKVLHSLCNMHSICNIPAPGSRAFLCRVLRERLSDSDVWPEVSEEASPWGLAGPLRVALFRKQHGAAGAESARRR